MDIIETIKKDKAYVKCKLIVKTWEKDFKTKYGRTPSKFDIKEAPSNIKYAYKKYFHLKSNALENSLSICDFENVDVLSPEPVQEVETLAKSSMSLQLDLPELPTGQELEKLLSNTKVIEKNVKTLTPFTENLSKKLFQNSKFSLRNPRKLTISKSQPTTFLQNKSFSTNRDITVDSDNINNTHVEANSDSLHDIKILSWNNSISDNTLNQINNGTDECRRTLLSFDDSVNTKIIDSQGEKHGNSDNVFSEPAFSKSISVSNHFTSPFNCTSETSTRHLDNAWLDRATGLASEKSQIKEPEKFGLANIRLGSDEKQNDVVENSASEDEDTVISKLKPALKKRKINNGTAFVQNLSQPNEENNETPQTNTPKQNKNIKACKQTKKKIGTKNQSKKSNVSEKQEPPDIREYLPFGVEKDIHPRHVEITNVLKHIPTSDNIDKDDDCRENRNLENKIKHGTLNDNFVKINIEKKVFVRGKKGINFSKYKKQQFKNKRSLHGGMEFPESGKLTCFKCGGTGHMSRYCRAHKGEALLPLESYNESDIPTLEDMQKYASEPTSSNQSIAEQLQVSIYESSQIPDSFMQMLATNDDNDGSIQPIYQYNQDFTDELKRVLKLFGHESFRPGQENAIRRILSGMSTLLLLSTGGGKSLCYQLPAYIYSQHHKCITLVISPLVSLMEDQVLNVPEFLKAGCYHNNQSQTQRQKILECLKEGMLNILLISPEALVAGDSSNALSGLFKSLPPIAFACIDEAHCVSQWSHNFRPSYLMICRVLREKLNVKCILGLTATASQTTIKSVINHINIPDGLNGVIRNPALPDNLVLSVSKEKDKDRALVSYLFSEEIAAFNSIIVYCIRRDECERVAAVLRSCLQETGKINMESKSKKRKRMSYIAETYHAGMSAAQRKKIQKHFMDGTLRIIVATVAFGMGINKSDIRCIIHYNMPSSFESYVQEVGRAGRDGKPAFCHLLLSNNHNDKNELLKHIYANSIDRPTIRKLLTKVFVPCDCIKSHGSSHHCCKGHEVGIPTDETVEELDLPSENIATLLCYVELHPKQYIKLLNNAYMNCKISSYGGPKKIHEAAKYCRPLAMALLLQNKKDPDTMVKSALEFNVIEVAAAIGLESGITKYQLKNLEWSTEKGVSQRSFLKVEFNTLCFRIRARGDLNPIEQDSILDDMHNSVISQEKAKLYQLEECNMAFRSLGNHSLENLCVSKDLLLESSNDLKNTIRNYFERDNLPDNITLEERPLDAERVALDVRALICAYKDCIFSGRSIARIFQGISSPNYPAIVWGRCKFWRSHLHEDFNGLVKIATQQIIQMKL